MSIKDFLRQDQNKLEQLIDKYPQNIPVPILAEFLGCSQDSVRQSLSDTTDIGLAWRQVGKCNRGFYVPTSKFVRWYTNTNFI